MDFALLLAAFALWILFLALVLSPWAGISVLVLFVCIAALIARVLLFLLHQPPRFRTPPPGKPSPRPRPVETGVLDYEPRA